MSIDEFELIRKEFGIMTPTSIQHLDSGDVECYEWYGLNLFYQYQSKYVIAENKLPEEVANKLLEKKQEWQYHMYFLPKCKEIENDLLYLYNKESLLALMLEMIDYQQEKQGFEGTYVARYDKYLEKINLELLTRIKPAIGAEDWVKSLPENQNIYQKAKEQTNKSIDNQLLRLEIICFDMAINPFLDKKLAKEIVKMSPQNLLISGHTINNIPDGCKLEIIFAGDNKLIYYREKEGIHFKYIYNNEEDNYEIEHYFDSLLGERISIIYNKADFYNEKKIDYDISRGIINENNKKRPASSEDIKNISIKLAGATTRVKNLFEQAMSKDEERKLKL